MNLEWQNKNPKTHARQQSNDVVMTAIPTGAVTKQATELIEIELVEPRGSGPLNKHSFGLPTDKITSPKVSVI